MPQQPSRRPWTRFSQVFPRNSATCISASIEPVRGYGQDRSRCRGFVHANRFVVRSNTNLGAESTDLT